VAPEYWPSCYFTSPHIEIHFVDTGSDTCISGGRRQAPVGGGEGSKGGCV
jgi:hypothetical protein